jgi:hypothetical protein
LQNRVQRTAMKGRIILVLGLSLAAFPYPGQEILKGTPQFGLLRRFAVHEQQDLYQLLELAKVGYT